MKKLLLLIIFSASLVLPHHAAAEDLTLPYPNFRPATPAFASSINANFKALETGVNENSGKIAANRDDITVNSGNIKSNFASIGSVRSVLATHGHTPEDIAPQGSGSGLDADKIDGSDSTAFAGSVHGHLPSDITLQGSGSGLDSDMLDGKDSEDFAAAGHDHNADYTLIGHTHPSGEITGEINADTFGNLRPSDFAAIIHSHPENAPKTHDHNEYYAQREHSHESYTESISDHGKRISKLESYGDLSGVKGDIADLQKTMDQLKSKIAELERQLKEVSR
jgi:hypothetical protein